MVDNLAFSDSDKTWLKKGVPGENWTLQLLHFEVYFASAWPIDEDAILTP
jgi:hypothetical protein